MRALPFWSNRLRTFVIGAALAVGIPGAAWPAVIDFSNIWSGPFEQSSVTILGNFSTWNGLLLSSAAAQVDPGAAPLWSTATWTGPAGRIETSYSNWVLVSGLPPGFLQYVGDLKIEGGTGAYQSSSGIGQAVALFFGGQATSFNQGTITLIPEPAVWVILAAGFGLLGFVRIRRAAHNGI